MKPGHPGFQAADRPLRQAHARPPRRTCTWAKFPEPLPLSDFRTSGAEPGHEMISRSSEVHEAFGSSPRLAQIWPSSVCAGTRVPRSYIQMPLASEPLAAYTARDRLRCSRAVTTCTCFKNTENMIKPKLRELPAICWLSRLTYKIRAATVLKDLACPSQQQSE